MVELEVVTVEWAICAFLVGNLCIFFALIYACSICGAFNVIGSEDILRLIFIKECAFGVGNDDEFAAISPCPLLSLSLLQGSLFLCSRRHRRELQISSFFLLPFSCLLAGKIV